ncbi:MAG TPA: group II truncated hemoglobin [Streptosporangiaceae bacterium]
MDTGNIEGLRPEGTTRVNGKTMLEHIGGRTRLKDLVGHFHASALADDLLGEMFRRGKPAHAAHLTAFLEEIMGGGKRYSVHHNGVRGLFEAHANLGITEEQRQRFVQLMMASADAAGLPGDERFRRALRARVEQGSMFSMTLSQPGAGPPVPWPPVGTWDW